MLELDFLECFSDLDASSQVDYETLLVWVYWRSMAKIATDARDYVFGIAAVANALADRMGLQYKSLNIDYSLTAAEAFRSFITRVMEGRFGIRAISIVRRTADFALQHPNNVKTEGLPSWVLDLANRDSFGLSTNGGLGFMGARHVCQDVIGPQLASNRYQLLSVNGSTLHIHAHSIGRIKMYSRVFPNKPDFLQCSNFALSLIPLLNKLPTEQQGTNHTPMESLLHSLRFGIDLSTSPHSRKDFNLAAFERYLAQALQAFVWSKSISTPPRSVEQTMSWFMNGAGHNVWEIAGLSRDFPSPNVLASQGESHQLCWILRKDGICEDIVEVVRALGASCNAFRRAFGVRAAATKIFIIQLDDDIKIDSSQTHQQSRDPNLLLGIGPDSIEGEEEVWAAAGTEWPFILERHPSQEVNHLKEEEEVALATYRFKGEAFVHGIMQGELFESSAPEWQQIILE